MPDVLELDIQNAAYSGYNPDGYLEVQPDSYGREEDASTAVAPYWAHHPLGFIARPLDPVLMNGQADPTQSNILLTGMEGGVGHCWPLEDTRVMPTLPQLQKGESMQYGPLWGNFVRCRKDGSIVISTATAAASQGGGQQVTLTLGADGSFQFVGPFGRLIMNQTGFHVTDSSGASMSLGAMGGLPPPLDGAGSVFAVSAGTTSLDSSMVACGPSAGVSGGPPALSLPLMLFLGTLTTAVAATAAAAAAANPTSPAGPAAVAAAATATAALATALTTVPSMSVAA